jgi:hypothetical protein
MENLEDYLETHYDIVEFITEQLQEYVGGYNWSNILKRYEEQGSGGMYLLAKEWCDEFTEKYKDVVWGEELEYYETLEEFLNLKNN